MVSSVEQLVSESLWYSNSVCDPQFSRPEVCPPAHLGPRRVLCRGVGDLVLVYKRVTALAGHTSRVSELLEQVSDVPDVWALQKPSAGELQRGAPCRSMGL